MYVLSVIFCRDCLNQMKQRQYCRVTEWIAVNAYLPPCCYCRRIYRAGLTLDGLRLKRNNKFVDKNQEQRLIYKYYRQRISRARRRLRF